MDSKPFVLERQPSIETEPKTLLADDMDSAREAALKIIEKHSKEEALSIFLEGLRPVVAVKADWDVDDEEYKDTFTIN